MKQYLNLLQDLLENGQLREDRTHIGTYSLFGKQITIPVSPSFPLVTTKKIHFKSVVYELLWFLKGSSNIGYLNKNGVKIWDEWATQDGELGPVYGVQWRSWPSTSYDTEDIYVDDDGDAVHKGMWWQESIDQLANIIASLKHNPFSRRHVVSAWNPEYLPNESITPNKNAIKGNMALAPCHVIFQFYVRKRTSNEKWQAVDSYISNNPFIIPSKKSSMRRFRYKDEPEFALDCHMYQRSADIFLGVPFNIASYALLTNMVAQVVKMTPGQLTISFGDIHLYTNHVEQAKEQLSRNPLPLSRLQLNHHVSDIDKFTYDDIKILGYKSHTRIKAKIAI